MQELQGTFRIHKEYKGILRKCTGSVSRCIHFSNLEGHMSRSRLIESVLVYTKYTLKAYIVKVMQCKGKFYLEDLKRAI